MSSYVEVTNRNFQASQQKLEKYCLSKKKDFKSKKYSIRKPSVIVPNVFMNSTQNLGVCDARSGESNYIGLQSEVCFSKPRNNPRLWNNLEDGFR